MRELTATFSPPASDDPRHVSEAQNGLVITAKTTTRRRSAKRSPARQSGRPRVYPGMFPGTAADGSPYGVYWPSTIAIGCAGHRRGGRRAMAQVATGKPIPADPITKSHAAVPPQRSIIAGPSCPPPAQDVRGARAATGRQHNVGFWVRHPPRTQPWLLPGWKPML